MMPRGIHGSGRAPRALALLALLSGPALLAGCTEVESATVDGYQPAEVVETAGSDVPSVRFTSEGARRTGLETARLERRGRRLVAPYAALIYDGEGTSFVYTRPEPLTFVRHEVRIDAIEGDRVVLTDGPPPGTEVVTTGAAEVYGTETGIAGGH